VTPHFVLQVLLLPLIAQAECMSNAPEPFGKFINVFARDKAFATSRTRYPISVLRHELGSTNGDEKYDMVDTTVSKAEDAATPTIETIVRNTGLEMSTSMLNKANATVELAKPETDWLVTFHFERKGHCWYLKRIEDHSP
jgi:hypothetical protein